MRSESVTDEKNNNWSLFRSLCFGFTIENVNELFLRMAKAPAVRNDEFIVNKSHHSCQFTVRCLPS